MHNNAGIGGFNLIPDTILQDWRKVFSIDVVGVFPGCKYAVPEFINGGGDMIINTAFISGLGADYAMASYNPAKAAFINLTRIVVNNRRQITSAVMRYGGVN